MITLTIPPVEHSGECSAWCPFVRCEEDIVGISHPVGCGLGFSFERTRAIGYCPGPECIPGTEFVLVPKARWEAYDHTMRVLIEEGASLHCEALARRALGEEEK